MRPHRVRLHHARHLLFRFVLAIPFLTATRAVAAPSPARDSTAARVVAALEARHPAPGALLAAQEKERVSKPKDETRHKPPKEKSAPPEPVAEEDEGFVSSCLGECLGSFFSSLFTSPTPPPPPESVAALRQEALAWVVGDRAWLRSTQTLWDGPGGEAEGRAGAGSLPHGAPVVVVETHASAEGMWLRVRPMDGVEPAGWVPASAASAEPPPPPTGHAPPRPRPTWGIMTAFGGTGIGPSELNVEYKDSMFRAEAQYLRFLPKQWQSGAGLGWRYGEGNPEVLYQTATIIEEPANSRIWMLDIGARGGQRYTDRSGFRFDWLLGPTLTYVHERADVTTFDRSTMAVIGTSVESLGRWAGGGDLRLGFGWLIERSEISLSLGGYIMAWSGHNEKPLSSDFVQSSIHGFDVLVAFTFPAP